MNSIFKNVAIAILVALGVVACGSSDSLLCSNASDTHLYCGNDGNNDAGNTNDSTDISSPDNTETTETTEITEVEIEDEE